MLSLEELKALFADVEPIAQDDGPYPVVPIAYTEEFVAVMDLFRAVIESGERSERTLELSEHVIRLNSANYTAWHYRRKVLEAIEGDWKAELAFCESICKLSPKNYQLWYHRREVVDQLKDASAELQHCAKVLALDPKNYHAWSHRQWVLTTFGLWENELSFVDRLLSEDPRNNSAWNQRWFVVSNSEGWSEESIDRELSYAFQHVRVLSDNESPWNYIVGLMEQHQFNPETTSKIVSFSREILKMNDKCVFAGAAILDALEAQNDVQTLGEAIEMSGWLGEKVDTTRKEYWSWRQHCLQKALLKLNN